MKENEELLEEKYDSLKMSAILYENKKEINLINNEEDSSNVFNFKNKVSSEEEQFDDYDLNKKFYKSKRKILIYNIKDHLMMVFLLLSSSMNFSILYIPLIIIGIIYISLLLNNNNDTKRIKLKIEIGCLIYCIILIIFKFVIFGIIENGNLDSEKHEYKLNNFGIRYKDKDKRVFDVIITFFGEGVLLIICIYSIFISLLYKKINMENKDPKISKGRLFSIIKALIYICYILLLGFAAYNTSYITYSYIFLYQIILIIITFKNNFPVIFFVFKHIRLFLLTFLPIQLLLINIFNIYYIQQKFLKQNIIPEEAEDSKIIKVYSFFTIIGINYSFYHSLLQFFKGCISYGFCVFIIVLLSSCKKIFDDYKNIINPKNKKDLYELTEIKNDINDEVNKNSEGENKKILNKVNYFFIYFFTHSEIIIHLIRFLSIIWIYKLHNFYSIGIFLFLFFSFIFNDIENNMYTIVLLSIPITIISFSCLHISNIDGYFEDLNDNQKEKYSLFGLEKDEENLKYFLIGLYYLFTILLLNSFTDYHSSTKVKINLPHNKILLSEVENIIEISENKIPLLMSDNEKKDTNNINQNKNENINLFDVILKFIYQNIDKITLVAMYFISMHTINVIHFIFIIIFMIQILQYKIIERFNKLIITIIQFLFLFEYIVDLTKNYYNSKFEIYIKLFRFLLSLSDDGKEINISIEIFCYIAIYAFYIQNQLVNSIKYQELNKNKNLSFKKYINFKFKNYSAIKYILFIIFSTLSEIYVWVMFCLFFCICNFEINLLFGIKLVIFFCVVYNFLQKTQINVKNINISLKSNSFLIAYCCFNSFIVYGYQLLCSDFFGVYNYIKQSNNMVLQNLPSIGLINYKNQNLLNKLFPHFLSNFLSIMMYYDLKSIYDRIEKEKNEYEKKDNEKKNNTKNVKKSITVGDIISFKKKDNNLINQDKIEYQLNENEEKENINIQNNNENNSKFFELNNLNENKEKDLEIKTNDDINNTYKISENKEEKLNIKKNDDFINADEISENKDDINNQEYINEENYNEISTKSTNNEIITKSININFEEEKNKYYGKYYEIEKIATHLNKKNYFYMLVIFILNLYQPCFFLFICYVFSSYNLSFAVIMYFLIFGANFIFMFINMLNYTCNYSYNYYHPYLIFQLIRYRTTETKRHKKIAKKYKYKTFKYLSIFNFIFLFLNYLYSIIYYLQDCNNNEIEKNNCNNETLIIENVSYGKDIKIFTYLFGIYNYTNAKELINSCGLHILFCFLIFMDIYIQKIKFKFDNKKKFNREEFHYIISKVLNLKAIINSIKNLQYKKENNNEENFKILEELIKNYEIMEKSEILKPIIDKNNFKNDFINIFKKSKNNKLLLPKDSTKRSIIIFLRITKKVFEYLIIFLLICGVIIKVNIWSIIYMIIVIYLLLTKKNINKFNYLFIIIILSIFIQSIIFLSNLNEKIDPKQKINEIQFSPWYDSLLGDNNFKFSLIFGLGIYKFQVLLLWVEYITAFLIYIYLYNFCFSIFTNRYTELKEWKRSKNSLIYKLLFDKEVREAVLKLKNTEQYQKIAKCMENNFGVILPSFSDILKYIINLKNNAKNKNIYSKKNKSHFQINLFHYIFYLFGHNIILITITVISMMINGFLSGIYICFCLYFLYQSKSINKGKIYYYPFVIKSLLRPIIIVDITCQLIIQIPYIFFENLSENDFFKSLSDLLGLIRITNNNIKDNYEITNKIFLLLGKCFCFFCMCIQKVIYTSKSFNEFYLSYIIIKNEKSKIISLINTFRFNNERINTMNNSMKLKKDMEDLMNNLQEDLKEWNKKLFSLESNDKNNNNIINNNNNKIINYENNNNGINNNLNNYKTNNNNSNEQNGNLTNEIDILNSGNNSNTQLINIRNFLNIPLNEDKIADKEIIKEVVKNWILGQTYLLKLHIFLNKKAFCFRMALKGKEVDKFIINTIQGRNEYVPLIERKIDDLILKLDLSSFKNNEVGSLRKYLNQLNKINSYDFTKIISFLNSEDEREREKEIKKKLNQKLKALMKQKKYSQFSKIKNSKIFKKYLKKTYLIGKIIIDILTILSNNFHFICFFGMILNHIINASIISLFYPISIFCYALLEYPRPSKTYWNICLKYTFIFLIIKYIIQKEFIGVFLCMKKVGTGNYYQSLQTFFDHYPIGIKLYDENKISNYFIYLINDFMVITLLIINTHILIVNGLWQHTEKYVENILEAMNRLSINKDKIFQDEKSVKQFNKDYLSDKIATNRYLQRNITLLKNDIKDFNKMMNLKDKYIEETKNYFEQLFPKIRNEKPGRDFYFNYSLSMMLLIIYVLFFYTTMVQDKTFGAVNISTNQFSATTIILVLIHMIILIFDRVIYLRQNRYMIKYEYNFYDKKREKLINENSIEFKKIKEDIEKLYPNCNNKNEFKIPLEYMPELNKNYNVIIFQNESFNLPLLQKYILHILISILSHLFIFFFITMMGNYNINNAVYCIREQETDECNDFLENKTIVIFYLIFLVYLLFSGLQIKYGFYDLKRKSIFKNINSLQGLLFEAYKNIPFYYPIKNVVDWTFTPTSLNLFDWFKFENIYDEIFKTYRIKRPIEIKPIGQKIKTIFKMLIGGLTSLILVLILVLPLILFSSLNPTNEINNINSAQMKIYLSFIDDNQEKNYLIFDNYWTEEIKYMTRDVWNNFGYSKSFYTKTFPQDQIQIVSFYSVPENTLSEFKLSHIISSIESLLNMTDNQNLDKTCSLIIETDFSRPLPNEAKVVTKKTNLLICDYVNDKNSTGCIGLNQTYNFFNNQSHPTDRFNITINGFSPFVRLTASSEPKQIELEINKALILKPSYKNNAYLFEIYFDNIISEKGIQYHVFNDKVSSSTSGYSILGFYSAFILVIGTYVSSFFNYNPEKIIIGEMPHPEKLLNLCECVKISRYTYDFKKEEYLFNILIEIMRTPDFIKKLTQSTMEQFQRRTALPS